MATLLLPQSSFAGQRRHDHWTMPSFLTAGGFSNQLRKFNTAIRLWCLDAVNMHEVTWLYTLRNIVVFSVTLVGGVIFWLAGVWMITAI